MNLAFDDTQQAGMDGRTPHDKQPEHPIMRYRERAASAPLHYGCAARRTGQRAVDQLRRHAKHSVVSSYRVTSLTVASRTVALVLLAAVAIASIPGADAQNLTLVRSDLVLVFRTHFEAGGKRFESADDLRKYLESANTTFVGVDIRECGAAQRQREATAVIHEVANKKVVEAGGKPSDAMQMEIVSVACPQE